MTTGPRHGRLSRWQAMTVAVWLAAAMHLSARADTPTNVLIRASSASRQFTVFAPGQLLASVTGVFAERVKYNWLKRLDLSDGWRDPIVIAVCDRDSSNAVAPALSVEAFQNEIHLKYQITCVVPPPLDERWLTAAVVDTLCEEFSNREQPTGRTTGYQRPQIPLWLVWGLTASIRQRGASSLDAVRRSVEAGHPAAASELLASTALPSDRAEQELFCANAQALTEGLLSIANGAQKLQRYLKGLGATKSASNAFTMAFGADFPQEVALEKWWSLQQAASLATETPENLSVEETNHQLDTLLPTALAEDQNTNNLELRSQIPLEQLWRYYETPWMQHVLRVKLNSLEVLRSRTHPFYRPVIDGYIRAVVLLMGEKLNQYRRAVAAADRARDSANDRARQITAYLDREERIFTPEEFSNWFAGYFQTLDQIRAVEENRHDPIRDYLDQFDQ